MSRDGGIVVWGQSLARIPGKSALSAITLWIQQSTSTLQWLDNAIPYHDSK